MKKLIKTILVLAILAGVMLFTCPEEQKHVDKLTNEIVETVQKGQDNEDDSGLLEEIGKELWYCQRSGRESLREKPT